MRVKVLRDFAGRDGVIIHQGEHVDFEDDADAYNLIHAGIVDAPLRLRSAIDALIGERWCERGELVDMPVDEVYLRGRDRRLEPLAAVIMAGEAEAVSVRPATALRLVAEGARYATREEAEGLDLGGADRFKKPDVEGPTGPSERLFFLNGFRLADGRQVEPGSYADVATEEAADLVARRAAERLVKVRVLHDNQVVVNRVCSAGEVVEVPRSIAGDPSRFERIGAAEKLAGTVVDVLALAGAKAAELASPAEKPEPAEKPARPAGRRQAAPRPGEPAPVEDFAPGDAR